MEGRHVGLDFYDLLIEAIEAAAEGDGIGQGRAHGCQRNIQRRTEVHNAQEIPGSFERYGLYARRVRCRPMFGRLFFLHRAEGGSAGNCRKQAWLLKNSFS